MKLIVEDAMLPLKLSHEGGMSEKDFYELCMANPDQPMERDKHGNIYLMAPTNTESGGFESDVNFELQLWNRQTMTGKVFSSNAGFTLPNGAVRAPDAAWVSNERLAELSREEMQSFAHVCPDFVMEIRSKSDRLNDLHEKMEEYIQNGCRLGFLVDPYEAKAWIYRPGKSAECISDFSATLGGGDVLPGFKLDLGLFRSIR